MKKIIFFFTLVLATAMIYGYSQSGRNELAENHDKQIISNDLKGSNKPEAPKLETVVKYNEQGNVQASWPGILVILTADKSKPGWSSSYLRNYIYGNTNQAGC